MSDKTTDELAYELLSSAFTFEKALLHYLKSVSLLIECQMEAGHQDTLGKVIASLIKQINEMQYLISRKILILSEYIDETELHALFLDYKEYENGCFVETIEQIYNYSRRCYFSDLIRIQLREEVTQLLRIFKEQQKWVELYKDNKNDPMTIWRA